METLEMILLFDYYGDLLTERQRMCFDLRHNQDLSLAEIAQELNVSRQGVHDNIIRAEAHLLERLRKAENVTLLTDTVVTEMRGEWALSSLLLRIARTRSPAMSGRSAYCLSDRPGMS